MAGSSSAVPVNPNHVRSTSMPSRSHPLALNGEEEISNLKVWVTLSSSTSSLTAEMIYNGLGGLKNLYDCIDNLLQLSLSQQSVVCNQHQKWVEEVLDGSVVLLDTCSMTRDLLLRMKENMQDLRSALRRRGGDLEMENNVAAYICSRKKMMKDIKKCIGALKQMDNKCASTSLFDQDQHLSMVVAMLRDVKSITISIFHAVLSFMSTSRLGPKPSKWTFVSKLMHKGQVACAMEDQSNMNEVESVDAAFFALSRQISSKDVETERVQKAQSQLEGLEFCIESLDASLESMFRCIIQTRVSLLNILTQ